MWIQTVLSLICFQVCVSSQLHVKPLTAAEFPVIKAKDDVQVIYFVPATPVPDELSRTLQIFTTQYEKSAAVLQQYGISLYNVDCKQETVEEYCNKQNVHQDVYIFRDDVELLTVGVESMFDMDSIISNVLQVVLLRDVPILQSVEERRLYEDQHKEENDIIFSYQKAIGTKEHRVFMEVAFANRENIKFALATDVEALEGLSHPGTGKVKTETVWVLQCKNTLRKNKKACPDAKYYGSIVSEEVDIFIKNQQLKSIYGIEDPTEPSPLVNVPLLSVYIFYDDESTEYVQLEAARLAKIFKGTIGLLLINAEQSDASAAGYKDDTKVPALACKEDEQSDLVVMDPSAQPEKFIENCLQKSSTKKKAQTTQAGEGDLTNNDENEVYEMEKQDDEVAQTMVNLKFHLESDNAVVLTEKTFMSEIKNRDIFVVLFHLPFDALSSGTLYSFYKAADSFAMDNEAKKLPTPFGVLNCYDWPASCTNNNITSWPTIFVYRKDRPMKTHQGILSPASLKNTAEMFLTPAPVIMKSVEEIENVFNAQKSGQASAKELVILGLTDDMESEKVFLQAADELHGELVLSLAKQQVAKDWAKKMGVSLPHVVVSKLNDMYQPVKSVPMKGLDAAELVAKIKDSAMPIFPELTPLRFPALFLAKMPIAIYFTPSPESPNITEDGKATMDSLGKLAAEEKFTGLKVTWMDMANKMTQQIMVTYTRENSQPTLVVVDLSKGCVYVYANELTDGAAIEKWMKDVLRGDVDFTIELEKNDWKPHKPGFNFLKMMDEEDAANEGKPKEVVLEDLDALNFEEENEAQPAEGDGEAPSDPMQSQMDEEKSVSPQDVPMPTTHTEL